MRAIAPLMSRASSLGPMIAMAIATVLAMPAPARADATTPPGNPPAVIAALALPAGSSDDARQAVVIGRNGEVYEPDGKGAWVRKQRFATSKELSQVGRAGGAIVAFGEGVVYRLAPNGWSAIRLHQKERAIMSVGARAVAAVGRQLFVLDQTTGGEPTKLAVAPSNVLAIGSGPATGGPGGGAVVIQTDRGLFRVDGARVVAVQNAPRQLTRIVSDRWVLVDNGAIDLKTGRKTGWPPGVTVATAAAMPDDRLVLVTKQQAGQLELVTLTKDKLERAPITPTATPSPANGSASPSPTGSPGAPIGVVVDRSGRAVIAFSDGVILVREPTGATAATGATGATAAWLATRVRDDLPGSKRGPPPAISP